MMDKQTLLHFPLGMFRSIELFSEVLEKTMPKLMKESGEKRLTELLDPEEINVLAPALLSAAEEFDRRDREAVAEFGVEVDPHGPRYQWGTPEVNEQVVRMIEEQYPVNEGDILFYGPSNITFWYSLEQDMLPRKAQNHGMGGCIDEDMIRYAPRLLYPYKPSAVFFQTGSNDIASGIPIETILENKKRMYQLFREHMPDTKLIVCSGLPLPGRTMYWDATVRTNELLRELCAGMPGMCFMDASDVMLTDRGPEKLRTSDGRYFNPELFRPDMIHLNKKGHDLWTGKMKAVLDALGL